MKSGFSPISILATGAVTAVGLTAASTAAAVRAGISGFNAHAYLVDSLGDKMVVAEVPGVAAAATSVQRLIDLAVPAAREALAAIKQVSQTRALPLVIGFPRRRPGISDGLAQEVTAQIADSLQSHCTISSTSTIVAGHAAGLMALSVCERTMREKGRQFGLVGAVDSYIDAETLEWLEAEEQLHTSENPWGFIPGEGAGFCLLVTAGGAAEIGQAAKLQIREISEATESHVIKSDTVCTGRGLTSAIRGALAALPVGTVINDIICDLNGEPYRADEYAFTIPRITERCADAIAFQNPADCWGDVGAASAILFLTLAAAAAEKRYARGPHTLLWTSSEGGERAAALVAAPQ